MPLKRLIIALLFFPSLVKADIQFSADHILGYLRALQELSLTNEQTYVLKPDRKISAAAAQYLFVHHRKIFLATKSSIGQSTAAK